MYADVELHIRRRSVLASRFIFVSVFFICCCSLWEWVIWDSKMISDQIHSCHKAASSTALLLVLITSLMMVKLEVNAAACNYTAQVCGNVSITYPFSMSPECGLPDQGYRILCKENSTYGPGLLPFLQLGTAATPELQLLEIRPDTIILNTTEIKAMPHNCTAFWNTYGQASLELPQEGPFVVSNSNLFAVVGCRADGSCAADDSSYTNISCAASCYNEFEFDFCNYYACCVNVVPPGSRFLNFTGRGVGYSDFPNVCGFSTILDSSTFSLPPYQGKGHFAAGHYGVSVSWGIKLHNSTQNCSTVNSTSSYACHFNADCIDIGDLPGYACNCSEGYKGDGYKEGLGCEDIDECEDESLNSCVRPSAGGVCNNIVGSYECGCKPGYEGGKCDDINECERHTDNCAKPPYGNCTNTIGSFTCNCNEGYTGNGTTCSKPASKSVALPAVLGGLAGALILMVAIIVIFGIRRAYVIKLEREQNFHRNGGTELRSMLFTEEELQKATKNYSPEHVLGKGGFGTVYWGILPKHGKVAIKMSKTMIDEDMENEQVKSFVSEILLLGKTTHENVVKLLGCCVETRVPLLVYEFVENGSLWDHVHGRNIKNASISRSLLLTRWDIRLHVAVGTARALSYLHKMNPPILHRDIKSPNILLDKLHNAKVADFGASCFLTSGSTHITFKAESAVGSRGYMDPEYQQTYKVTDKSDVYSFGVVLLELITSLPVDLGPSLGLLAHHFRVTYRAGKHMDDVDGRLINSASHREHVLESIEDVAKLANYCLAMEGHARPSMQEVFDKLKETERKFLAATQHLRNHLSHNASDVDFPLRKDGYQKQVEKLSWEEVEITSLLSSDQMLSELTAGSSSIFSS